VLGPQWQAAVPVVQSLAIYGAFAGLSSVQEVPMWVKGKGYVSAIQSWLEFCALVPLLVFAVRWNGIEGAAMSRAAVAAGVLPTMLFLLSRSCDIPFADLAKVVWRPLVAGVTMTLCIIGVPIDYPALPALVLKIMIGAPVYAMSLGLLWLLAGRPDGIERLVVDRAKRFLRRGSLEPPGIAHRE
jgi:PST family polysaccharide transporter